MNDQDDGLLTRREFNQLVALAIPATAAATFTGLTAEQAGAQTSAADLSPVQLHVNGQLHEIQVDPRTTLLEALREHLGLMGTKKGCDHGQCGACTVLVDGRRMYSCLSLAVMHVSAEVTTIEGVGTDEVLHPMQAAFIEHDGFQCGFCTSGQILSAIATLDEIAAGVPSAVTVDVAAPSTATAAEIRERLSGNLCRCAAYPNIVAAVMDARGSRT